MVNISPIKILESKGFTTFASGAAGAVYTTTAIKAGVRPAFIYGDKHSDKKTKKYTAGKEFIYQVLCLGIAMSIVPFIRKGGFELAKKNIKELTNEEDINKIKETLAKTIKEKADKAGKDFSAKIEEMKKTNVSEIKDSKTFDSFYKAMTETKLDETAEKPNATKAIMQRVHGGEILGEFVGSICGLTILAPLLSMIVLHPILKVCGLESNKK
jgi:ribosomal protein S8E